MQFKPVMFKDSGVPGLAIDIADLDLPDKEDLQQRLLFKMPSYGITKMVSNKNAKNLPTASKWENMYTVANRLLESMKPDMAKAYVRCVVEAKRIVDTEFITNEELGLESKVRNIATLFDKMEQETNLCEFISEYITNYVPFALTPDAGRHAQDSQEMTWYPTQAHILMIIVLLCKVISPIYGAMISVFPEKFVYRDHLCAQIPLTILDRKYPEIVNKLKFYIKKIAARQVKEDKSAIMAGITTDSMCFTLLCSLLSRAYVNVNLLVKDSNPVTMTHVDVKRMITTANQETIKHKTEERRPPTLSSNDDDRVAQLEIDSMTSKKTCDVIAITNFAVKEVIERMMVKYDISVDEFNEVYGFYQLHPIVPNCINRNLNDIVYSSSLGGSDALDMLKANEYTKLTCLLQMILFSLDVNYKELAHMMTGLPGVGISQGSLNTNVLKTRATTSEAFRALRAEFEESPHGMKGKDWEKHVEKITNTIIVESTIYNTANFIWNWLEEDNKNGSRIQVTEQTMDAFSSVYLVMRDINK